MKVSELWIGSVTHDIDEFVVKAVTFYRLQLSLFSWAL